MLEYIFCPWTLSVSSKLTVFLALRSGKTVHYSEQMMSADKYPNMFLRQMESIVYIIICYDSQGFPSLRIFTNYLTIKT